MQRNDKISLRKDLLDFNNCASIFIFLRSASREDPQPNIDTTAIGLFFKFETSMSGEMNKDNSHRFRMANLIGIVLIASGCYTNTFSLIWMQPPPWCHIITFSHECDSRVLVYPVLPPSCILGFIITDTILPPWFYSLQHRCLCKRFRRTPNNKGEVPRESDVGNLTWIFELEQRFCPQELWRWRSASSN